MSTDANVGVMEPLRDDEAPGWVLNRCRATECCWHWTGPVQRSYRASGVELRAYAAMVGGGRPPAPSAARSIMILARGPLAITQKVLHRCDEPLCVRPTHLYVGTAADNARDAVARAERRAAGRGERVCSLMCQLAARRVRDEHLDRLAQRQAPAKPERAAAAAEVDRFVAGLHGQLP